jgi:hypothetical protein
MACPFPIALQINLCSASAFPTVDIVEHPKHTGFPHHFASDSYNIAPDGPVTALEQKFL